jgi:hypothetical protein
MSAITHWEASNPTAALVTVEEHDANHEYEVCESQTEDDPPRGEGYSPENLGRRWLSLRS